MKRWAIRGILILTALGMIVILSFGHYIRLTLGETSLSILEDKLFKEYDPFFSLNQEEILEEGSIVKQDELKSYLLFSSEQTPAGERINQLLFNAELSPLEGYPELLQVNNQFKIAGLLKNDCQEIYCYQHYLPFDSIPTLFWKGLIGIEDKRYLDHFGVDPLSLLRAFLTNIKTGKYSQGGSTISQQLVKNLFLTNEKTFSRKIKEMIVSLYVESKFPKEKILEAYLNEVHWGALQGIKIKGVFAASLIYFGKKPSEITPFEGAILVGLLKGPGFFNPLKNLEKLKIRTKTVYKKLVEDGTVGSDPTIEWQEKNWNNWYSRLKKNEKSKHVHSLWQTLKDEDEGLGNYEKYVLMHKISDVKNNISERLNGKLDTRDISIKVLVGPAKAASIYGYYSKVERNKEKALKEEKHQIGSTVKPIVYDVFLDFGKKMADYVSVLPLTVKLKSGPWSPKESHAIDESEVTLLEALLRSYNRPVIRIAEELGFLLVEEKLKGYFPQLKTPLAEFPSGLLGSIELSVSEFRSIYLKFIEKECKKILSGERIPEESVLYLLSDPNQTTVEKTVDGVMQKLKFFGKTGTTNNGYDNWYVAFDGKNLTLVWVGYEGERKTKPLGLYGATTAFEIFQNFYRDRGKRFQHFGCEVFN